MYIYTHTHDAIDRSKYQTPHHPTILLTQPHHPFEIKQATLEATARNPADYTAWQARRSALLLAPGTDPANLETELHTTAAEAVLRAPKCFQTWHHRRCVLDRLLSLLPPPSEGKAWELLRAELAWGWARLVGEGVDPKNVHAWAHRRWVLERAVEAEEGGSAVRVGV